MRLGRSQQWLVVACWMATWQLALADIDAAEYNPKSFVRSDSERKRLQSQFETDIQKEAQQKLLDEELAAQRQAAEKTAWEALAYPVRLTRTRCTLCHVEDNFVNQRHNRIGWEIVILRMQLLNNALLAAGERSAIAAHLSASYPAAGGTALMEALQQLAVALSPVWLWFAWKITRARFGKRR